MKWPLPHRRLTYWSSVSVCLSVPGVAYWYWCGLSVHLSVWMLQVAVWVGPYVQSTTRNWVCVSRWTTSLLWSVCLSQLWRIDTDVDHLSVCLSVTGCRLRQSSCAVYHANHVCVSRLLVSASFSLRRHRRVKQVSASTCHWAGSQRSSTTNSCM